VFCALAARDFKEGVILAINHDGDSDCFNPQAWPSDPKIPMGRGSTRSGGGGSLTAPSVKNIRPVEPQAVLVRLPAASPCQGRNYRLEVCATGIYFFGQLFP
jgi:hypothetical protein